MDRRSNPAKAQSVAPAPDELGRRMFMRGIALHGALDELEWRRLLLHAATALGMSPVGVAAAWRYPLKDGSGGNGTTMVQPITESFLALDTWPDLGGAYLFVCSCKPFPPNVLTKTIETFGLQVGEAIGAPDCLRLC
ncbi:MAG: S-adenosylmethionine decarboxylase [Xanthobacteraceae bacterium]|jgi:S-adenosylmethionine/arginine decarboxylase-like enzyme